jgi:hypothetical protein
MRQIVVLLVLACCIAFVSVAAAAKGGQTTNVKSKATLTYVQTGFPPYDEGAQFSGKVKGAKAPAKARKACKKGRKVKLAGVGQMRTTSQGTFAFVLDGAAAPGTYQAKVKKKTIVKHGDKVVCKKGLTNAVVVG